VHAQGGSTPSNASHAQYVGKGYCTATTDGWAGDCTRGLLGSWRMGHSIPDAAACIQRCHKCTQCRFVSISTANRDCSWYAGCIVGSLGQVYGGESYSTYRVKVSRRKRREPLCSYQDHDHPDRATASGPGDPLLSAEPQVHFVTFYSEGPPHDPGIPLGAMAGLLEAAFKPHVDSFRGYTPSDVRRSEVYGVRGESVVKASNVTASMNTGLSAIGQLAAKPFVSGT
jgi:hypothetical protein